MVQAVLTPSNLGADFDIGITTPNAINVKVATTSTSGKIARLATSADVTAGTVGAIPDAALLKSTIGTASVRTDINQGLTGIQKNQARLNISDAPFEALAYQNIAVNPRHVVSQFNGNNSVAAVNGYVTDGHVISTSGITLSGQRVSSPFSTRPELLYGLQATVTTASGTLAAGSYAIIAQNIEGIRVARLLFGTANAKNVIIGFMAKSNISGTFCVTIRNGALNRSYTTTFILSAGTETFVTVIIPGDITGAWTTDMSAGLSFTIALAVGSTYQGAANTWQSNNVLGTSGQTNWAATAGNTFVMSDLIILPSIDGVTDPTTLFPTDRLPLFQRQYEDEFRLCQRYYRTGYHNVQLYGTNGWNYSDLVTFGVDMRTAPAVTLGTTSGTSITLSVGNSYVSSFDIFKTYTGTGTGNAGVATTWTADSRL